VAADCRARCVDGADLGVAEHTGTIANADPRCPVHGELDSVQDYIAALEKVAMAAVPVAGVNHPGARAYERLSVALAELKELD